MYIKKLAYKRPCNIRVGPDGVLLSDMETYKTVWRLVQGTQQMDFETFEAAAAVMSYLSGGPLTDTAAQALAKIS